MLHPTTVLRLCAILCALLLSWRLCAQPDRKTSADLPQEIKDFVIAAKDIGAEAEALSSVSARIADSEVRSRFSRILHELSALARDLRRQQGKLLPETYLAYRSRIELIELEVNSLSTASMSLMQPAESRPSNYGECFSNCGDVYGRASAGGHAWYRIWCKISCFGLQ